MWSGSRLRSPLQPASSPRADARNGCSSRACGSTGTCRGLEARGTCAPGWCRCSRIGASTAPGPPATIPAARWSAAFRVAGVVRTGGFEEDEVLLQLEVVQALLGRPGSISLSLVSVVTVPLDGFGRQDPGGMTRRELEKWFCTPYV